MGSGLIGLDVAYALSRSGVEVSVVEMASRIMPLQTDEFSAKRYQNLLKNRESGSF